MFIKSVYKASLLALTLLLIPLLSNAQCSECPVGSTLVSGNTNITDQNNTTNYCIDATWNGTVTGIGNNSTITICPGVSWNIPSNISLQQNIEINNYGTITDNDNGYQFKIQGQTDLINKSSGTITVTEFENQDTDFLNEGSLTAETIYLHGPTTNSGFIESTENCSGNASTNCGFYIGSKGEDFNNTGTVLVVDALIADGIIGGGTFESTGTLTFQSNSNDTENNFITNNLNLQSSSLVNEGLFVVNGDFNCNNASVSTTICLDDATGNQISSCSGSSVPIVLCSVLPAEFISFDVRQSNENVIFTWEIGEETNVSHYEIMHSPDGNEFRSFAEIEATNEHFYQYSQKGIETVFSYFKIRSIDFDGTITEFDKIRVLRNDEELSFIISPNPVSKSDLLNIQLDEKLDVLAEIYDLNGKKIHSKFYQNADNINLALDKIQTSGLYILKVVSNKGLYTKEIFIR